MREKLADEHLLTRAGWGPGGARVVVETGRPRGAGRRAAQPMMFDGYP